MLIELIGPYATGKTNFAKNATRNGIVELADQVKASDEKNKNHRAHPFFKKSIDLFLSEDFIRRYLGLINNSYMPVAQKLACINMFYASAKRYSLCMQLPEKKILEDEGLLLRGLDSTACSHDVASSVKEYFSNIPLPDVVIFCSSGIEKEKERIVERGVGINPFYSVPVECVLGEVERVHERFRLAEQVLRGRKGVKFFSLDLNMDGVDAFSRKLHELVE